MSLKKEKNFVVEVAEVNYIKEILIFGKLILIRVLAGIKE